MQDLTLDFDTKTISNFFNDGKELIIQKVQLALQTWTGDWFLDGDLGTPYDIRFGSKSMLLADLEEAIMSVDGVLGVEDLNVKIVKEDGQRVYKINATINTTYEKGMIVDGLVTTVAV